MKKKFLLTSLLFLFFTSLTALTCFAATLSPAIDVISYQNNITVNGISGSDIVLSKKVLKDLLGCRILKKIKITSLPDQAQGILTLKESTVKEGDIITSKELNHLTYKSNPKSIDTDFSFTVFSEGTEYNVTCRIAMLDSLNFPPVINKEEYGNEVSTFEKVSYHSNLSATDPENDTLTFEILKYPQKGLLVLKDGKKGTFCYTPFDGASGTDSFYYIARDCFGNTSEPEEFTITIRCLENGTDYSDMSGSEYQLAATALSEKGIFTGEKIGDKSFFYPDKTVTKGEFLMYAMTAANITPCDKCNKCDNICDLDLLDRQIRKHVLCGYTQGYLNTILSLNDTFEANSPITFAEAASIINKICGFHTNTDQFVFVYTDNIPATATLEVETLIGNCTEIDVPNNYFTSTVNRGQCAEILYKSIVNKKQTKHN